MPPSPSPSYKKCPMRLRPCEPEDLDLLYSIENTPDLWDTTDSDAPYSRYALKRYIAAAQSIHACGELRLVAEISDNAQGCTAIGTVDLTNYSPLHARAEVGIALLQAFRGQGYGSEALRLLESFAVSRLRIHILYAHVSPKNLPSWNLFLKGGYQEVATLQDWLFSNGKYEDATLFVKYF